MSSGNYVTLSYTLNGTNFTDTKQQLNTLPTLPSNTTLISQFNDSNFLKIDSQYSQYYGIYIIININSSDSNNSYASIQFSSTTKYSMNDITNITINFNIGQNQYTYSNSQFSNSNTNYDSTGNIYTLLYTVSPPTPTATFSSNAVTVGNSAATVTTSALRLADPTKTSFTDDEAADIAYLVRQATSHFVSSVEKFGEAVNKTMRATMK